MVRRLSALGIALLLAGCTSNATPSPGVTGPTPTLAAAATPSPTVTVAPTAASPASTAAILPLTAFSLNVGMAPAGFAVDATGNIYAPGGTDGYALVKLAPDGSILATWAGEEIVEGEPDHIGGVAVDPASGDVFATDTTADHVIHLTADLAVAGTFGATGHEPGQLTSPLGLVFDPAGHLVVVDAGNNRIETFTRDGSLLSVWDAPAGPIAPFDVAVDRDGNLVLSSIQPVDFSSDANVAGQVLKFSPARQPLLTLKGASSPFAFPDATVDQSGHIVVQDSSGQIFTFSPTGDLIGTSSAWPEGSGSVSTYAVRVSPSGQVYVSGCLPGHCRIAALDTAGTVVRAWESARPPDRPGSKVPTGRGYSLYLQCAGTGSPTVLWEDGAGGASSDDVPPYLLGRLARITRVCFYDRAGLGLSDPAPYGPESGGAEMVTDLHAVLGQAGISGPYVLAGWSFGGMLGRLFAATYPGEIVGMVQVEGLSEAFLPDEGCTGTFCGLYSTGVALQKATHGRIKGSLGTLPLVVLSENPALATWGTLERRWQESQRELATASSNAVHAEATWSSHLMPSIQPGLVIEAIREVVSAARSSGHTLDRCGKALTQLGGKCL